MGKPVGTFRPVLRDLLPLLLNGWLLCRGWVYGPEIIFTWEHARNPPCGSRVRQGARGAGPSVLGGDARDPAGARAVVRFQLASGGCGGRERWQRLSLYGSISFPLFNPGCFC